MNSRLILFALFTAMIFSSCTGKLNLEKRKYRPGYFLQGLTTNGDAQKTNQIISAVKSIKTDDRENSSFQHPSDTIPENGDTTEILTLSSKVGDVIDSTEKSQYHLFPFWDNDKFLSAQFIRKADSSIVLVGKMKDGTIKKMPYTKAHYLQTAANIEGVKRTNAVSRNVLTISPIVGDTIDSSEKKRYFLFPKLKNKKFVEGQFIQKKNGSIVFTARMKNGKTKNIHVSKRKYKRLAKNNIESTDDYNSRKAKSYATAAIIFFIFWFLLAPIVIAAYCAIRAYKYGKLVTNRHDPDETYTAKRKAQYGIVIGSIAYTLLALLAATVVVLSIYWFWILGICQCY